MNLQTDLCGITLKNPLLTASGTFGYGLEFAPYGDLNTLGGIVTKGLSLAPKAGNPMPRIAETHCGMLNAVGLQNIGMEAFLREKLLLLRQYDLPVIVNIYGVTAAEFAEIAGLLAREEGVAAIEANISCPNVKAGGMLFGQDPQQAARVTEAVKSKAGNKPVIIKLSPNVTDIAQIARAVEEAGADCISCINTLAGMAVDIQTKRPRLANVVGGLSGPAIKPVALRCVYQVASAVGIPVIGLGGIASAEDVLEFMLVGARAVQVGTSNFFRPDFMFQLVADLERLVQTLAITSWDDWRGGLDLG